MSEKVFEYDPTQDPAYKPAMAVKQASLVKLSSKRAYHSTGEAEEKDNRATTYDRYAKLKGDIVALQARMEQLHQNRIASEQSTTASAAENVRTLQQNFHELCLDGMVSQYLANNEKGGVGGAGLTAAKDSAAAVLTQAKAAKPAAGKGVAHQLYVNAAADPELVRADRHLALLEKQAGVDPSPLAKPETGESLHVRVADLISRLQLLGDYKLDNILTRIKTLATEFDGFDHAALSSLRDAEGVITSQARGSLGSVDDEAALVQAIGTAKAAEAKIVELNHSMNAAPSSDDVAEVASRLQTQQDLHFRGARAVARLRRLQEQQDACAAVLNRDYAALTLASKSLESNLAIMKSNAKALQAHPKLK